MRYLSKCLHLLDTDCFEKLLQIVDNLFYRLLINYIMYNDNKKL